MININNNNKIDISLLSQPSDLFGKELLPECTFESEYGILKFNSIVVPDFSNNKVELESLTKHFDQIKAFIKEEDLLKKSGIIDSIFEYVPHATFGRVTFGLDLTKSFLFINILRASVKFRLFENGKQLSYDICSYFGYDMSNKINYSTIMSWNGTPIEKPLLCATGIYIQSLGKCLNPNASGIFYDPELISDLSKNKKVPSHNYLSWAIHGASLDELVLHFVEKREIIGLLYK